MKDVVESTASYTNEQTWYEESGRSESELSAQSTRRSFQPPSA